MYLENIVIQKISLLENLKAFVVRLKSWYVLFFTSWSLKWFQVITYRLGVNNVLLLINTMILGVSASLRLNQCLPPLLISVDTGT